MDPEEGLTDNAVGEVRPRKKLFSIPIAFFAGAAVVFIFLFIPDARDFLREAGSVTSKSLSDTFSPDKFGKRVAEINFQPENAVAVERAPSSSDIVSGSGTGTRSFAAPVLAKQSVKQQKTEFKPEKSSAKETKFVDAIIFPIQPAGAASGSGSGGGAALSETAISKNILIAEVQIAGASTTNDFIKIFNAGNSSVDLGGWKLRKKTVSGKEYSIRVFPDGSVLSARGIFLWANSQNNFDAIMHANTSSTETLAPDNSIALFDANGVIADALAWGSSTNPFFETFPYITNPTANKVLSRKLSDGAMQDTNNNSRDFEIK